LKKYVLMQKQKFTKFMSISMDSNLNFLIKKYLLGFKYSRVKYYRYNIKKREGGQSVGPYLNVLRILRETSLNLAFSIPLDPYNEIELSTLSFPVAHTQIEFLFLRYKMTLISLIKSF
jgi:hypothetical protein